VGESDQRLGASSDAAEPVEADRAEGGREAPRRVGAVRRRRPAGSAVGALVAAAAVVTGVVVWWNSDARTDGLVVDGEAEEVAVTTACGEFVVPRPVEEYLNDWTGGSRTLGEVCVLEAVGGPEPDFDLSGLGDERVWLDDDLDRGRLEPPDQLETGGYPVVYIGTAAVADDDTLRVRLVRSWSDRPGFPVFWCTSTLSGSGCGPRDDGEEGMGGALVSSGSGGGSIEMLVPENTAVAALTIDGEPVAWQRPRGRTVLITAPTVGRFTVTAYDASGSVIDEYSGGP
jgi:hypothetical protein